jgi:DNA helicase HerA-like ATPase
MEAARTGAFKAHPLVVFIDEAHQFLNNSLPSSGTIFPLDSFALIAKEGRKYALTVALATQRPRDIPEDVLSQMGTLLIHRLINDNDRKIIERASGEMDSASAASIPILASGQGILVGVDFPVPLSIKMAPPGAPPDSSGADYQTFWKPN